MTKSFSLSANIENGVTGSDNYIVTPNVEKVVSELVSQYQAGVHSFTIIGTYGTGKSCFLLNLEQDLLGMGTRQNLLVKNPRVLAQVNGFDIINIVGEYNSLEQLLSSKLRKKANGDNAMEMLRNYHNRLKKLNKMLVIAVDEFGKVLEHAAKNEVEKELYFMQQLAEFANVPGRNILLLTTLHQNFSAYASRLTAAQKNEWTKVKGRFQEIVFAEPVEQLLFMAAKSLNTNPIGGGGKTTVYSSLLKNVGSFRPRSRKRPSKSSIRLTHFPQWFSQEPFRNTDRMSGRCSLSSTQGEPTL